MRILLVKLSSLGDVVHAMPALQDIRQAWPHAQIDWVVERGFAPLVARCEGISTVICCELRLWRRQWWRAATRQAWRAFVAQLQGQAYDAVIDLQGLSKSALVARLARLAPGGRRYALANRTEGSGYEAPTRWVADVALRLPAHIHAMQRSRELCARALGYSLGPSLRYGLDRATDPGLGPGSRCVALVHGTSRDDKLWPEPLWQALGERLLAQGCTLALPHGSASELARAERLAQALGPHASVWPRMALDALTQQLARCHGVIGVDSGLSHIAVALHLPHVQIYNFDTAWRTGPLGVTGQCSVVGQPHPSLDAVWHSWCAMQEQVAQAQAAQAPVQDPKTASQEASC